MHRNEILKIIRLAHYFQSAFSQEQVWRLMQIPMQRKDFDRHVADLILEGSAFERKGRLYAEDCAAICEKKKIWSRLIYKRHLSYLKIIARMPWIRFLGLSGANAFESCKKQDDLDLFIVTSENRLWIAYLAIVLFSKMFRKRRALCVNYLLDEANLYIRHQNYYTAVQLFQMVPLYDAGVNSRLLKENRWALNFLPNVQPVLTYSPFYGFSFGPGTGTNGNGKKPYACNGKGRNGAAGRKNGSFSLPLVVDFWTHLNRIIFRKYQRRLSRKFPAQMGKGIVVSEGLAKLNRLDYQDLYDRIFRKLEG